MTGYYAKSLSQFYRLVLFFFFCSLHIYIWMDVGVFVLCAVVYRCCSPGAVIRCLVCWRWDRGRGQCWKRTFQFRVARSELMLCSFIKYVSATKRNQHKNNSCRFQLEFIYRTERVLKTWSRKSPRPIRYLYIVYVYRSLPDFSVYMFIAVCMHACVGELAEVPVWRLTAQHNIQYTAERLNDWTTETHIPTANDGDVRNWHSLVGHRKFLGTEPSRPSTVLYTDTK